MSYNEMKQMPGALKPALLLLTLLQIIFMASPGLRGFGWFVCLTSILEFITSIAVVAAFFFDLSFIQSSQYSLVELAYSAVFCVCSALNTIYYFINIFYHFNFWFLLATITSVLIVLAYGLQTLINWSARGTINSSSSTMPPPSTIHPQSGGASFPAGVNPA